jgi:hypothetical protein
MQIFNTKYINKEIKTHAKEEAECVLNLFV